MGSLGGGGWLPTIRGGSSQQGTSFNSGKTIQPSFLFVNFCFREVKQLAQLKRKALKLVKLPSFESDLLKSDDDIGAQSHAKFYGSRPFVWLVPDTKFIGIELHPVLLNVAYS